MKKLSFFITIGLSIIIINGLIHSIYTLWNKQDLIKEAEKTLSFQKEENRELKTKLREVQSKEFVEQEARNKLFLVKKDEAKVVLPEPTPTPKVTKIDNSPNWQKWLKLLGIEF
ncbi:MAG: septum formation initiator family protein [Candidatus Levybacteria bacterium]|nr:septum formation initiator family protein [Candidatus Levybacteria bacterium]MBI4098241.1 septum formation initiator family protein [Candidatus Levybacteria bacterium]